jgi:hypothetical protein
MLSIQPPIPRPRPTCGGSAILPQSKIQNQQSSFINPISLHGQIFPFIIQPSTFILFPP